MADDRKKLTIESSGLKAGKVVYIHIKKPFVSSTDQKLWSTEVWYTMNKKPAN